MEMVDFDEEKFHQISVMDTSVGSESIFTVPKRYSNLIFLSAGSQGSVVIADDAIRNEKIAIKKLIQPFLMDTIARRTYREFVLLTSIKHKNIIKLLNAFTPQNDEKTISEIYLVMELMSDTLHNVLRKIKLTHRELSFFVYQMLCAIKHLHQSGIMHRDLKPTNIVLNDNCELRVLDFGLARKIQFNPNNLSTYVVTRWYRAPEVIFGVPYTEKVDVWSIGCIFAEMIHQRILFPGTNGADQWAKIQNTLGAPPISFLNHLNDATKRLISSHNNVPIKFETLFPDSSFRKESEIRDLNAVNARDLLSRMLIIDPNSRCSVEEALNHPYIRSWWNDKGTEGLVQSEIHAPISHSRYDVYIDTENKSLKEWKALIFNEVKLFEKQHDIFTE